MTRLSLFTEMFCLWFSQDLFLFLYFLWLFSLKTWHFPDISPLWHSLPHDSITLALSETLIKSGSFKLSSHFLYFLTFSNSSLSKLGTSLIILSSGSAAHDKTCLALCIIFCLCLSSSLYTSLISLLSLSFSPLFQNLALSWYGSPLALRHIYLSLLTLSLISLSLPTLSYPSPHSLTHISLSLPTLPYLSPPVSHISLSLLSHISLSPLPHIYLLTLSYLGNFLSEVTLFCPSERITLLVRSGNFPDNS